MYLSAQRVVNAGGRDGINVAVYTHRGLECPGIDWSLPDVSYIADHCPGRLAAAVRSIVDTRPRVLAFLDVAVAEALSAPAVARLVEAAAVDWPGANTFPAVWYSGPVGLRFFAVRDRRGNAFAELHQLKDSILRVLGEMAPRHETLSRRSEGPLVCLRNAISVGHRYELSPDTVEFLRAVKLSPRARSISVSLENSEAFATFVGRAIEAEVIQSLTGLRLEQVDAIAGVEVVDAESGETVWRSPGVGL